MDATAKQLAFIREIEDQLGVRFKGYTKSEATKFIQKYFPVLRSLENEWAIVKGYG